MHAPFCLHKLVFTLDSGWLRMHMGFPAEFVTASMSTENLPPRSPESADELAPALQNRQKPAHQWAWVPIRSLGPRHRGRIGAHLIALTANDRYLRFGYPATDAQLSKYVDLLDFERDEIFGIFNRRLELIAMAHLAYAVFDNPPTQATARKPEMAEFGVSVLSTARGRGFGARLFDHATLHARNRNVKTLFIHALSENAAMLHIARQAGAVVERDGSESEAWLKLPPDTLATQLEAVVEQQAAELDYQFKVQAQRVQNMFGAITDLKSQFIGKPPAEKP